MNKNVISIAPFDTTGTSGLVGDLKTFHQWRCYGMGVATELVAANTTGIQAVYPVPFEFIAQQLESITADVEIHGVKIGALRSADSVKLIASLVEAYRFRTLILDPCLKTKTGAPLVSEDVTPAIREFLLPKTTVLVVNAAEAAMLSGKPIGDMASMREAAIELAGLGPISVIVTGGHLDGRATDVLYDGVNVKTIDGPKLQSHNTLGIGSVFSASILSQIVRGTNTAEAIANAKKFVAKAIVHPFVIGHGNGPLNLNVPV